MIKLTKLQANFHKVEIGKNSIYFSYETPIAVKKGLDVFVSENIWSATTGRHINSLMTNIGHELVSNEEFNLIIGGIE